MNAGVPATPLEWVDTFVVINAVGTVVESIQLPNKDPQNHLNIFDSTRLSADSTGKVIVTREMRLDTQVSWPSKVPAISIEVYDPATETWPYTEVMSGDSGSPDNPYGYQLDWVSQSGAMQPTSDALNFLAHCKESCPNNDHDQKVYSVEVSEGLGTNYPRNTVVNAPASEPYVALGDSYSSGEGVIPFEEGTETTGTNTCHRSHYAYARVVGRSTNNAASLGRGGFYACSGAETKHIAANGTDPATPQWNEGTQISHLDANTKVVTLTIGGNDIDFVGFGSACVYNYCGLGSPAYATSLNKIDNELPGKLTATYQAILAAAPDAQIYVLGYPQVAPVKTASDPIDMRCPYLYDGGTTWADAQGARSIVTQLNSKIENTVDTVRQAATGNTRLEYVDVNESGSPFEGYTVCADSSESYFYNIDQALANKAYVFHPNRRGQEAYAKLIADALN